MLKFLFITTLIFCSQSFAQDFKSADDVVKKLSAYTVADIDGDASRLAAKQKLKIDFMFEDLQAAVKYFGKNELTEEATLQLERVSLLTFLHDPTGYAAEIVMPLYDKNVSLFKKASKKLHPVDQELVLEIFDQKSKAAKDTEG